MRRRWRRAGSGVGCERAGGHGRGRSLIPVRITRERTDGGRESVVAAGAEAGHHHDGLCLCHDARDYDASLAFVGVVPFQRDLHVGDLAAGTASSSRRRVAITLTAEWTSCSAATGAWPTEAASSPRAGPEQWGELMDYTAGPIATLMHAGEPWLRIACPLAAGWSLEPGVRIEWNSFTSETSWQPRVRVAGAIAQDTGVDRLRRPGADALAREPARLRVFHLTPTRVDGCARAVASGRRRSAAVRRGWCRVRAEAYRRWFDRLLVQRS